jgi:transcriptional regulator with XRE-family HTH domain
VTPTRLSTRGFLRAFARRLRHARERQNLSQEAVAKIAHVHRAQLSALELGRRDPHLTMLLILADALKVSPGDLLEGLFVPTERRTPTRSNATEPPEGKRTR